MYHRNVHGGGDLELQILFMVIRVCQYKNHMTMVTAQASHKLKSDNGLALINIGDWDREATQVLWS